MPTVVFMFSDGRRTAVQAREGMSLMEVALRNLIDGVEAKCRGNCACVTCHVHVDPRWRSAIGAPSAMEESMLDFAEGVDEGSRLACQVRLTNACEGMVVSVPGQQRTLGL
jgi:2Fe-2S ferredoxin